MSQNIQNSLLWLQAYSFMHMSILSGFLNLIHSCPKRTIIFILAKRIVSVHVRIKGMRLLTVYRKRSLEFIGLMVKQQTTSTYYFFNLPGLKSVLVHIKDSYTITLLLMHIATIPLSGIWK